MAGREGSASCAMHGCYRGLHMLLSLLTIPNALGMEEQCIHGTLGVHAWACTAAQERCRRFLCTRTNCQNENNAHSTHTCNGKASRFKSEARGHRQVKWRKRAVWVAIAAAVCVTPVQARGSSTPREKDSGGGPRLASFCSRTMCFNQPMTAVLVCLGLATMGWAWRNTHNVALCSGIFYFVLMEALQFVQVAAAP